MNRSHLMVLLAFALVAAGVLIGPRAWSQQAADPYPSGCVDCHKVAGGVDTRLNVLLSAKKHVDIAAIVRSVPDGCMMCHRQGVQTGPLSKQAHPDHNDNPQTNKFTTVYKGTCLSCHKADAAGTPTVALKLAPKNW